MSIRIDGGVVVGWSGSSHEIIPNGSVLIDGDTIKSVGTDNSQSADKVIQGDKRRWQNCLSRIHQSPRSLAAKHRRLSAL